MRARPRRCSSRHRDPPRPRVPPAALCPLRSTLFRGSALLNFEALVSSLGGDGKALLRARGVDPAAAGDYDAFLSSAAAAAVVADAANSLDCPDFGMRLAREQGIQILGPIAVIIRNAETVGSALDGVSRFLHNLAPTDHVELIRGPEQAVVTFTTSIRQLAQHDQWVEKGLGLSLDAFRLMLGEDFAPVRVTMQHRRISPTKTYDWGNAVRHHEGGGVAE